MYWSWIHVRQQQIETKTFFHYTHRFLFYNYLSWRYVEKNIRNVKRVYHFPFTTTFKHLLWIIVLITLNTGTQISVPFYGSRSLIRVGSGSSATLRSSYNLLLERFTGDRTKINKRATTLLKCFFYPKLQNVSPEKSVSNLLNTGWVGVSIHALRPS